MKRAPELQIQIDDVYACPGSCAGCALSLAERKVAKPDMAPETLALAFSRLREYVGGLEGLEYVNLTYAIADHLTMPDAHLELLYREAASFLRDTGFAGERSTVFFSTSLIGRPSRVVPRLEFLAGLSRGIRFLPVAVLDPAKLRHPGYGADYAETVRRARTIFGAVDLALNLSAEAVRALSPAELHAFAAGAGFREVTVNWVPNAENLERTTADMPALTDWLLEWDALTRREGRVESSFGPVALRAIDAVRCAWEDPGQAALADVVAAVLPETVAKSIEIDHQGNLAAKFEAVGDVPHAPRFGYRTLGHLSEAPIADLVERAMPGLIGAVVATHTATPACMECPHLPYCAATGYHIYNRTLRTRSRGETSCPHVGRALFDHFARIAADPETARA